MAEVETKALHPLMRLLLRVVHPAKGKIWTQADLAEVMGMLRFLKVFLITILLPGLVLALLGIRTIESDSNSMWAELREKADVATNATQDQIRDLFSQFEQRTLARIASGQSTVDSIGELSQHLRVAFVVDSTGKIIAPFRSPVATPSGENDLIFNDTWREAQVEFQSSNFAEAVHLFGAANAELRGDYADGASSWAQAVAMLNDGREQPAIQLLTVITEDLYSVRNAQGFRFGDLARLKLAEIELAKREQIGVNSLISLSDDLLDEVWTIGFGGEAAICVRALELLDGLADTTWLSAQRSRLESQTSELFWAGQAHNSIAPALRSVENLEEGAFSYSRTGPILWASTIDRDHTLLFAFELGTIEAEALQVAAASTEHTPEVEITVLAPQYRFAGEAIARAPLAEALLGWDLVSHTGEIGNLERRHKQTRRLKMVMIATPLMLLISGAFVSLRIVGREIEIASMKADFAANVSHDLRSPITQIRLKGEFLQLGLAEEDELQSHYDIIVRESERLSRLVDNVLDFSSIESGKKRYRVRPADITETVRIAVEAARFSMETRGIEMEVDLSEGMPVIIHEPEAIQQVIQNLISNAAKYGEPGGWIGISAKLGHNTVEIAVSDRGIGISDEDLPQIFEKFFRSESDIAQRQKGTGIGLTIVQYIMEAHHGAVRVKSSLGHGTTFTLHFPIRAPIASGL